MKNTIHAKRQELIVNAVSEPVKRDSKLQVPSTVANDNNRSASTFAKATVDKMVDKGSRLRYGASSGNNVNRVDLPGWVHDPAPF